MLIMNVAGKHILSLSLLLAPLLLSPLSSGGVAHAGVDTADGTARRISLNPAQIANFGIASQPLPGPTAGEGRRYPARVAVPQNSVHAVGVYLPGIVERVHVAPGDHVRKGQTLMRVRSPQLQELQREVQQSASQAQLAQRNLERDEQLLAEGLISQSRLDATQTLHHDLVTLARERAKALEMAGAGIARDVSGVLEVRSPIDGEVLEVRANAGERLDPSVAVMEIAALDVLWIELQVPVQEMHQVRIGDAVRMDGIQDTCSVTALGARVDPGTQTVTMRATLQNRTKRLRPGQAVEASVASSKSAGSRVPTSALVYLGHDALVFVDEGQGKYLPVRVRVERTDGAVASVAGITRDMKVVSQGTAALKSLLSDAR
jgi:RND family efflux transporter MFP subunit